MISATKYLGTATLAAALIVTLPTAAYAQSSTRILKYNDKGEVTGVVETESKMKQNPAAERKEPGGGKSQNYKSDTREQPAAEPGEIIVFNPPSGFTRAMRDNGYTVLERIVLETLGLTALRYRTPSGVSASEAVRAVETRYPSIAVGVNQRFTVNAGRQGDYGRSVIGWGEVPAACGSGIRIGMIDTLIDVTHPAIKGQRIARRSFIPKGTKPGISDHGTAVAGLLVGKSDSGDWKGLLPGAALYAANIFAARSDGGLRANLASMMKALDWLA